jgi:hypothetical protein
MVREVWGTICSGKKIKERDWKKNFGKRRENEEKRENYHLLDYCTTDSDIPGKAD